MTFWRGSWLHSQACHKCRLYDFDEIALDCVPGQVAWDLVGHVCISRCRVIQQSDGNISKIQYRTPSNNVSGGKTILDPRDFPTHRCLPLKRTSLASRPEDILLNRLIGQKRGYSHSIFTSNRSGMSIQLLSWMGFSILARNGLCSLMICWLLLVPAGVPVLVSLLLSSFFPQERGSVPSWFAGSSWFRLGFRCLSPFFFLLSFLRKGVLFHHDLLVPLGSGWGSGACLPSSLFFSGFSLRKGVLFHHGFAGSLVPAGVPVLVFFFSSFLPQERGSVPSWICWFLLVPAGVPVLVSLLLSSFFSQEKGSVPSWISWFLLLRLGFRCLSPFFSLLSFLRKGFCSIMICWFLLVPAGVPVLVSLLLSSLVPVLVSLLLSSFFPQERGSVPSWFAGSSWFRLGFRCLSPFFSLLSFVRKGVLFHHDLLVPPVPAGVPVLVSLLLSSFFPQERGSVPSWFAGSSWFRLGFRCLSPFFSLLWFRCLSHFFSLLSFLRKGVLFHHDLLVPPGSGWGSGACLPSSLFFFPQERGSVPSWFAGSSWFRLGFRCLSPFFSLLWFRCLSPFFCLLFFPQERGSVPSWFAGFLLVPAGVPVLVSLLLSSLVPVLVSLLLSSFFPQERGSVPSWFAGSSWFRLGFRCLSPFFSLLSFLRKGVLFHHDLLVPLGSGWGSGACLPSSLFFLSSGKGFCSIMICWFLLVPAGVPVLVSLLLSSLVPVLVSLLLSSFFPQERGSVPSWFAGSSWFRLGFRCLSPFLSLLWFRCLSPFFSLLSFLRKGVLFHHDLLGSSWFRLGFRCLSPFFSLLSLSPFFFILFFQERGSVPSWFAGSSWFRLGFRCLSPFFSLLSFLRKGVLFHHDLLVPPGSGWGSGACLPSSLFFGSGACLPSSLFFLSSGKGFCSIMICWFLLVPAGVPVLVSLLLSSFFPQERGSVPSWFAGSSVPAGVPVLVSLLLSSFFPQERGSVPSWFAGSSWFRLGFRCLSPFFSLLWFRCLSHFFSLLFFLRKGVLFHHDLLVPPGSGWGSGACLPFCLLFGSGACLPSSLFFGSGACLPSSFFFFSEERGSVASWFAGSSWFRPRFRCLSPFFSLLVFVRKRVLVCSIMDFLVPPVSGWGSDACLPSSPFLSLRKGLLFHHGFPDSSCFRLGFRCWSPFFSFFFSGKGFCSFMDFLVLPASGWGSGACLLSSLFFIFLRKGVLFLHGFPGSSCFGLGFRCLSSFFSLLSFLNTSVPDVFF